MGFDDGDTAMLKNGSQIQDTTSAIVLEDLIGQFLYGSKNQTAMKNQNPQNNRLNFIN